jgi:hypothetical protein
MVNVVLCPGLRVMGTVGPLTKNPVPVIWNAVSVSFPV